MAVERGGEGPVPVTLRVDDAAYWLEEWHRLRELPPQQAREAAQLRAREFSENPNTRNRLRLALLLAEGPPAVRDQRRALALLQQLDDPAASASARALAALLQQVIREQLAASGKISELTAAGARSAQRVQELEQQLQELTDIEQSIQQRVTPMERKENQ
jgi:hypothetical protein